jgi:hypothetical protein
MLPSFIDGHAERIDGDEKFFPAADDHLGFVSGAVMIRVFDQRDSAFGCDVDSFGSDAHADGSADFAGFAGVINFAGVFESIVVGVGEDVNAAVIADGEEFAIGGVFEVVDVGERDRQLAHGEARDEHVDGERLGGGGSGEKDCGNQEEEKRERAISHR